jgi:hypothetical protein
MEHVGMFTHSFGGFSSLMNEIPISPQAFGNRKTDAAMKETKTHSRIGGEAQSWKRKSS